MEAEKIIAAITEYFTNDEKSQTAMIYGSLVKGTFSSSSDVDIAVDLGRSMEWEERLTYIDELGHVSGRDVDLVDLFEARGLIHYEIVTKGIRIKSCPSDWFAHMKRALYFHADLLPQLNEMSKSRIERFING